MQLLVLVLGEVRLVMHELRGVATQNALLTCFVALEELDALLVFVKLASAEHLVNAVLTFEWIE